MAIELIDKIKPKNNGSFPMVDATDVEMPDGSRLPDALTPLFVMVEKSDDGTYTADKSDAELAAAYIAHRPIYALIGWILSRPFANLIIPGVGGDPIWEFSALLPQGYHRIRIRSGRAEVEVSTFASASQMPVYLTEVEYKALELAGKIDPETPYHIYE